MVEDAEADGRLKPAEPLAEGIGIRERGLHWLQL